MAVKVGRESRTSLEVPSRDGRSVQLPSDRAATTLLRNGVRMPVPRATSWWRCFRAHWGCVGRCSVFHYILVI